LLGFIVVRSAHDAGQRPLAATAGPIDRLAKGADLVDGVVEDRRRRVAGADQLLQGVGPQPRQGL
jgi:hypothetical protein